MSRLIALCDCNNFFVSCERIHRPDLDGKPVVVLSANDGCIISRSQEVKDLGVKMGEPFYKYKRYLERHGTAVFSTDFPFYRRVSKEVMATLSRYTDTLEVYSVDEAFMNMSIAAISDVNRYAAEIRDAVYKSTRIPISIGIAPTRTLAKLASDYSKKHPETGGIYNFSECGDWQEFLKNTPAQDVWGIGRRSGDFLRRNKVKTAFDYMALDDLILKKERGIGGLYTAWELRGTPCVRFERSAAKKSIQVARSFGREVYSEEDLRDPVTQFIGMAASEMRRQGSRAGSVRVMIRSGWYSEDYYANSAEHRTRAPLSDDGDLVAVALELLSGIYKKGPAYKKAGVLLGDFSSAACVQGALFEEWESDGERDSKRRLLKSIETINAEIGYRAVRPALYWKAREEPAKWLPNQNWKAERNLGAANKTGDIPSHSFRVYGLDRNRLHDDAAAADEALRY